MLTVSEDGADLAAALRHGAQGYLLKTIDGDLLAQAIAAPPAASRWSAPR
jgi:two-component system nitrate/nitrite response regulator NarL